MKFNPPPNWPVPKDWEPGPQWRPPATWPPAPPGWDFWTDKPAVDQAPSITGETEPPESTDDNERREPAPETTARKRIWRLPAAELVAICVVACVIVAVLVLLAIRPATKIETQPHTEPIPPGSSGGGGVTPDWPAPWAANVDFSSWTTFGGIDAEFSGQGRSVLLDTHDTTDTWRTKWSGLIQDGPPMCAMRFTGRARDVSHAAGVPGGFGIGLATLGPGDPDTADLSGTAIQFDFGQQGFRSASYPSDTDIGLQPAPLDHEWHQIEAIVKETSHTLVVDGRTVTNREVPGRCGNPVIRVWAGSAEFTDFTFGKLGS